MKKAKQILALMLVVVMVLGMMVFTTGSASAMSVNDYTDADSIEYKEAVDVLTALGVLAGDDRGFRPTDTITREEAAKIITYILIGKTSADRLAPRTSSFTDVATSRWSNPYIEYCVEKGIIKGYGDGRFGPADPVTASQMSKMLLMCIGYGGKGEFDKADSWELNSIVNGQKRGILSIDEDFTKPATREQVALYTFNTMTDEEAFLVSYSDLAKDYLPRGSSIFTESSKSFLGAETFDLVENPTVNALGYTGRTWKLRLQSNADSLTGFYRTDVTLYEGSGGTAVTTGIALGLTEAGSPYFKAYLRTYNYYDASGTLQVEPIRYYINGVEQRLAISGETGTNVGPLFDTSTNLMAAINGASGTKGVIVDLIDRNDDGHADKVVIIQKTSAVILADPSAGAFGATIIPGVLAPTGGNSFNFGTVIYPTDLKSGDIVLYYADNTPTGRVTHIEKAKSVSGALSAYNKNASRPWEDTATVGGTRYFVSGVGLTSSAAEYEDFYGFIGSLSSYNIANYSYNVTAYLDDGNNIIAFVADEEAELNFLVTVSAPVAFGHAAQIEVVRADGVRAIIDVTSHTAGNVVTRTNVATMLDNKTIYSYTVDANGKYALKDPTNPDANTSGTTLNPVAKFDGTNIGDDSTVFVVQTDATPGKEAYKVFKGVQKAPTISSLGDIEASGDEVRMAKNANGIARMVYVEGTPTASDLNMKFFLNILNHSVSSPFGDGLTYYTLDAVNPETGATEQVMLTSDAYEALVQGSPFSVSYAEVGYYGDKDIISAISVPVFGTPSSDEFTAGTVTSKASGGTIVLDGEPYTYNSSTKVYSINALFGVANVSTISAFNSGATGYIFGKLSSNPNTPDLITEIYVVPSDQVMWVSSSFSVSAAAIQADLDLLTLKIGATVTISTAESAITDPIVVTFADGSTENVTAGSASTTSEYAFSTGVWKVSASDAAAAAPMSAGNFTAAGTYYIKLSGQTSTDLPFSVWVSVVVAPA